MAGPQSAVKLSWNGLTPCDGSWLGVDCSGSAITSLTLPSQGFAGELPDEFAYLNNTLASLDLSSNPGLIGNIPLWIGAFTLLQHLDLQQCGFNGPIPDSIGNLKELTFLQVTSNQLTGPLPASIGNLSKLIWLDIGKNLIEGPLPSTLGGLTSLQHFHGWNNSITGPIPRSFGSLPLIHLLLDNNELTGGIPSELGNISSLKILRLSNNPLGKDTLTPATIPSTLQNLTKLTNLELASCSISGVIPSLDNMRSLQTLDVSNNNLEGGVSTSFGTKLLNLSSILMSSNSLSGTLSDSLGNLLNLVELDLSNNKMLGGTIPSKLGNPSQFLLRLVDLSACNFTDGGEALQQPSAASIILRGNPICMEGPGWATLCANTRPGPAVADTTRCPLSCDTQNQAPNPDQDCICKPFLTIVLKFFGTLYPAADFFRVVDPVTFRSTVAARANLDLSQVQLADSQVVGYSQLVVTLRIFPKRNVQALTVQEVNTLTTNFKKGNYTRDAGPSMVLETIAPSFTAGSAGGSFDAWKYVVIIASGLILLGLGVWLGFWWRKRMPDGTKETEARGHASSAPGASGATGFDPVIGRKGPQQFSIAELSYATDNFNDATMLGKGGYGNVYKGRLPNGMLIAVKKASEDSLQGIAEFKVEIAILSQVYHKNLIRLLGYCHEGSEQMLVYEYMPNGNLKEQIHQKPMGPLSFETRVNIALGSARGLAYLHHQVSPQIIHRDIKTTNILLSEDWEPKVADFGLSKETSETTLSSLKSKVKGTFGYMDPEYQMTMRVTEKSDVFSFGVVVLELFTAMPPVQKAGKHIIREVKAGLLRGGVSSIVDSALDGDYNIEALARIIAIALQCAEAVPAARPDMSAVVRELESIAQYIWRIARGDAGSSYSPSPSPSGAHGTGGLGYAISGVAAMHASQQGDTSGSTDVQSVQNPYTSTSYDVSNPSFHHSGEAAFLHIGR